MNAVSYTHLDVYKRQPGRLTPEEFEIMKTHTTIGADMLEGMVQYLSLIHI